MAYKHGIYVTEAATSITPTVEVDTPAVAIVTAPIHLADSAKVNEPVLCYTKAEAVAAMGYSESDEIWDAFTAPQVINSMFDLYGVKPVVLINVVDSDKHVTEKSNVEITVTSDKTTYELEGFVLADSVKVTDLEAETDYTVSFNDEDKAVLLLVSDTAKAKSSLTVSYKVLDPTKVTSTDIIGGYDSKTGKNTGISLIDEIYPRFRVIPGCVAVPGYTKDKTVATVLESKTELISGLFRTVVINDLPTEVDGNKLQYTDVPAYKLNNGYTGERMINCFPMLTYNGKKYYYSAQMLGVIGKTDYNNDGAPSQSPSNQSLCAEGIIYSDGTELVLNYDQVAYLNGQGIVSAINGPNGWTTWGNRTGAYPENADIKDNFIAVKRMFLWIANNVIVKNWGKLDNKMIPRIIDSIIDDTNMWLNGLTSREHILGGELSFNSDENSTTDLMDGKITFRLKVAPPPPMREINEVIEYDTSYLSTLFE
jgi:hypothetical protein